MAGPVLADHVAEQAAQLGQPLRARRVAVEQPGRGPLPVGDLVGLRPADADRDAGRHRLGPGVGVHVPGQVPGGDDPAVDLLGQRGQQLVLEHLALPVLQQDALVGGALGDPGGELGDRLAALVVDHVHGDDGAGLPVDPVVLLAGGQRVGEVLERDRHPVRGVLQRALGDLPAAAGRGGERVEDPGHARGQHPADGRRPGPGEPGRSASERGQVLAGPVRVGPAGWVRPGRGGRDAGQRAQVGPGELAELRGLLVQLPDRVGERLPLVAQFRLGGGGLVVLGAGPRVVFAVRLVGRGDELLGLPDLLQDVLDVRLQGLLQRAELLFQGLLQPLPLGERRLGLGVARACAVRSSRSARPGHLRPGPAWPARRAARPRRSRTRRRPGRSRPPALPRSASGVRRRPAGAAGSWRRPRRSRRQGRSGPSRSPPGRGRAARRGCRRPRLPVAIGRVSGSSRRARRKSSSSALARSSRRPAAPRSAAGGADQLVVFGEPGAAAGGPVGRADVLRGRLRPGADVDAVAELGLGADRRDRYARGVGGCRR